MHIFLIDTTTSGHHLSYLKLFAKAFNELQHDLTVISPATYQDILDNDFVGDINKVHVRTMNEYLPDFTGGSILTFRKYIRHTWLWMRKVVDETVLLTNKSPDLVFFSTIDPYIGPYTSKYEIDYYFPYPWTGLYMKPQDIIEKWKYSAYRKSILNPNHILQSRRCKSIGIFIEPCAEPLSKLIGKPVVTFPDIVNKTTPDLSHIIIKDIIKEARGRKIISLLGSLEKRKGLLTLLQAAKKLPEEDFFFVFAGELSKSSFTDTELLLIGNVNLPNAYFFLKRIPEESTFNGIILISTIVFAAYINFPFSSNLVGKAACFNKPLLVSFGSYIASEVSTNRLGESAKEGNVQDVQDKIIQMTSKEYLDAFSLDNGCKEYADKNSYSNFQVKLKQLLDYIS